MYDPASLAGMVKDAAWSATPLDRRTRKNPFGRLPGSKAEARTLQRVKDFLSELDPDLTVEEILEALDEIGPPGDEQ